MVKVERITLEEAKSVKRSIKPSAIIQEYIQLLKDLPRGEARRINAKTEKEKAQTIKNRLVRVAKVVNASEVTIKRVGDTVYFWKDSVK